MISFLSLPFAPLASLRRLSQVVCMGLLGLRPPTPPQGAGRPLTPRSFGVAALLAFALLTTSCKGSEPPKPFVPNPACVKAHDHVLSILRAYAPTELAEKKFLQKRLLSLSERSGRLAALKGCTALQKKDPGLPLCLLAAKSFADLRPCYTKKRPKMPVSRPSSAPALRGATSVPALRGATSAPALR